MKNFTNKKMKIFKSLSHASKNNFIEIFIFEKIFPND